MRKAANLISVRSTSLASWFHLSRSVKEIVETISSRLPLVPLRLRVPGVRLESRMSARLRPPDSPSGLILWTSNFVKEGTVTETGGLDARPFAQPCMRLRFPSSKAQHDSRALISLMGAVMIVLSATFLGACNSQNDAPRGGVVPGATLSPGLPPKAWIPDTMSGLPVQTDLTSLSCPAGGECTAVGFSFGDNDSDSETMSIVALRAGIWSTQTAVVNDAWRDTALSSVSCPTTTFCMAVGLVTANNATSPNPAASDFDPLAERETSSGWSLTRFPALSGLITVTLTSVSCTSSSFCMAVGNGSASYGGGSQPVAYVYNGAVWQAAVSGMRTENGGLSGVSCRSESACFAVGSASYGGNYASTNETVIGIDAKLLAIVWNGSAWTPMTTQSVGSDLDQMFNAVSCSPSVCVAVGSESAQNLVGARTNVPLYGLAEVLSDQSWRDAPLAAVPESTSTSSTVPNYIDSISSVSCTTQGCVAAEESGSNFLPIFWNGTSWVQLKPPGYVDETDIDCLSSSTCVALLSPPINGTPQTLTSS